MAAPEYRIVIGGLFESVSFALRDMPCVEHLRRSESHLLLRLSSDVIALARPTHDGWASEMVVFDPTGGMVAFNLAELLRSQLDYDVSGPVSALVAS